MYSRTIGVAFLAFIVSSGFGHAQSDDTGFANDLPIFDAHMHYKEPAWDVYSVVQVMDLMDKTGVAMAFVSSSPDDGTIQLWKYAPNRVVPSLRPYHGSAGSSNWTEMDGMAAYLEGRLNDYSHEGIGEFHIRSRAMWNEDLFREIIGMAKARDIYLQVHSNADPIRWLYDLDPDVKIIWAHGGLGESADTIYETMAAFPNLLADTSQREWSILGPDGTLDPVWRRIIFDFQDRLMVGSDTWVNSQWDNYGSIIDSNRRWLGRLPRVVAEKIAYKNAERTFGRDITTKLIGTR